MSVQLRPQTVKISAKGQVVIPAPIRKKFGWEPGIRVVVKEARPMEVLFRRQVGEENLIEKYAGSMKGKIPTVKQYLESKKEELKLEG